MIRYTRYTIMIEGILGNTFPGDYFGPGFTSESFVDLTQLLSYTARRLN